MHSLMKVMFLAACMGAVHGIVQALLKDVFGLEAISGWWDTAICILLVLVALSIANKWETTSRDTQVEETPPWRRRSSWCCS